MYEIIDHYYITEPIIVLNRVMIRKVVIASVAIKTGMRGTWIVRQAVIPFTSRTVSRGSVRDATLQAIARDGVKLKAKAAQALFPQLDPDLYREEPHRHKCCWCKRHHNEIYMRISQEKTANGRKRWECKNGCHEGKGFGKSEFDWADARVKVPRTSHADLVKYMKKVKKITGLDK